MKCVLPVRDELAPPALHRAAGLRQVLLALAPGDPVSAALICGRFGVSPLLVCGLIDALRASGLPVLSPSPAWYQLPWPVQVLDAKRITTGLPAAVAAQLGSLEVHFELDSTSAELQRQGVQAPDLSFILAETQSSGRGRRGRQWLSPPGLNVHLSCLKRFQRGVSRLAGLSLVVGLSVIHALEALDIGTVGLKWPNDVLARVGPDAGGKLAGILVELGGSDCGQCTAVIGVGLNLRVTPAMRERVTQATCDLATLNGGVPPERNLVITTLIAALVRGLRQFEGSGFAPFHAEYARHDLLCDQPLQIADAHSTYAAIGTGIDERGALRVRLADGSVRALDSAEITVRGQ